jgi:TetR/AcrR family transcriptional repressor of mexJK operon
MYAVVDGPARTAILSGKTTRSEKDLRERVTAAVGLFLDGCRDRTARRS